MAAPAAAIAAARLIPLIARTAPAIARAAPAVARAAPIVARAAPVVTRTIQPAMQSAPAIARLATRAATVARMPAVQRFVRAPMARSLVARRPLSLPSVGITATRLAGSRTFGHLASGNLSAAGRTMSRFVSFKANQLARDPMKLARFAYRTAQFESAVRRKLESLRRQPGRYV